jgi:CxxC motif-containing protein (DUF1111 family)
VDPPTPGGLGQHLDQASCLACHLEGLSRADAERWRPPPVARLLRPHDVARYGWQVNMRPVPGSTPQGRVVVRWETSPLRLADGTEVRLRCPHVAVARADGGGRPQLAGPVALRCRRRCSAGDCWKRCRTPFCTTSPTRTTRIGTASVVRRPSHAGSLRR